MQSRVPSLMDPAAPSTAASGKRTKIRRVSASPSGFRWVPDFVSAGDEDAMLAAIVALPFERVKMRGYEARREVVHLGWRYSYDGGALAPGLEFPDFLRDLRERVCAHCAPALSGSLQGLVTRYPTGAGIGWHRDAPQFGPVVVGVSLGSACHFRMRLADEDGYTLFKLELPSRALYVLEAPARFRWQHSIAPVHSLRHSITFRTVKANALRHETPGGADGTVRAPA